MNPGEPHSHCATVFFTPYVEAFESFPLFCVNVDFTQSHVFNFISRKGPLSYRTPDFTKVEPRVRFPKQGYHPPRSRRPCERKSLSPEPILVFKSPTGIVKDVVLNTTAGSPSSSHSPSPRTSAPNLEFKGRQQATLLDHLEVVAQTGCTSKGIKSQHTFHRGAVTGYFGQRGLCQFSLCRYFCIFKNQLQSGCTLF